MDKWYVHYDTTTGKIYGLTTGTEDHADKPNKKSKEINFENYPERPAHHTFDGTSFVKKSQEDIDSIESARWRTNRRVNYPNLADQLDMIYHHQQNGTTTWKDTIQKIKTDFPKPSE